MRYYYTLVRTAKTTVTATTIIPNAGEDVEKLDLSKLLVTK